MFRGFKSLSLLLSKSLGSSRGLPLSRCTTNEGWSLLRSYFNGQHPSPPQPLAANALLQHMCRVAFRIQSVRHMAIAQAREEGRRITQDKFTDKACQAFVAHNLAEGHSHQIVKTEHLLKAMLEQPNGLAHRIATKAGSEPAVLLELTEKYIQQPKASGDSSPVLGHNLEGVVNRAMELKDEWRDQVVSIDHLILALADDPLFGATLFKNEGLTNRKLEEAIMQIRVEALTVEIQQSSRASHLLWQRQLEQFEQELTERAKQFEQFEQELEKMKVERQQAVAKLKEERQQAHDVLATPLVLDLACDILDLVEGRTFFEQQPSTEAIARGGSAGIQHSSMEALCQQVHRLQPFVLRLQHSPDEGLRNACTVILSLEKLRARLPNMGIKPKGHTIKKKKKQTKKKKNKT